MVMLGYVNGSTSPAVQLFLSAESPVPHTETQVSLVMGAGFLGAILGTVPPALLMSRLGRRGTLIMLNVLPLVSWILTYNYTTSFPLLFTARLLAGSWMGTCLTIIPIYISEIVDPTYRSFLNTLPCLMQRVGTVAVFTVGTYSSYREVSLVGLVCCFLYWIILFSVPESPYYYLMVNKQEKAFKNLSWLQSNESIDEKFNKLSEFIHIDLENETSIFGLFRNPAHLKNVITVTFANIFSASSGGVLIAILPFLIPEHSLSNLNNNECSIIGAVVSLCFSFRPKCLTLGSNKLSFMISGTVCGTCMATMAMWYYFENQSPLVKHNFRWVPLVCYLIHTIFYSLYMYPTVLGLRGEMFPTKYKNSLAAFIVTVLFVTVFIIQFYFLPIQTHFGSHVNFIIGCVSSFSLVILTYFCLIETEGKSLQDIQHDLNSSSENTIETEQNKGFS